MNSKRSGDSLIYLRFTFTFNPFDETVSGDGGNQPNCPQRDLHERHV